VNFRLHHLALAACLVTVAGAGHAATYSWAVAAGGNWSDAANWSDGALPVAAADTTLVFGRPAPTLAPTWTITNNQGEAFTLNALNFAGQTSAALTLRNASGSGLAFSGPGARIDVTGLGRHTLSNLSGSLGVALLDDVAVAMGLGELVIASPISGSGTLSVTGTEDSYGLGRLTLSGNNSFSGGLTLHSGNLILSGANASAAPVGTGVFTVNGGVLSSTSTMTRINAPVQLNADLRTNTGNLTFNGPITVGQAGVSLRNEGANLTLNTALDHSGDTLVGVVSSFYPAIGPATLTLGGTTSPGVGQGTLLNTASVTVAGGSTLNLDNSSSSTGNLSDRINDSAPVRLNSGTIVLRSAATGSSEALGETTAAGFATLQVQPGSAGAGVLNLASLQRADRGVLLVRGQNLGQTGMANHARIVIGGAAPAMVGGGGAAGSTTQSIVPWIVGNFSATSSTGNLNSFVTVDPVAGLRPLNLATEYATALGGSASENVLLSAPTVNDAQVSVNALLLQTNSLTGTGRIHVGSGAVMYSGTNTATLTNDLHFGSAEAVFSANSAVAMSGRLTGSNGLTRSGQFSLQLSGDNTGLTGPLTLNGYSSSGGARIDISSPDNLPGTGAITVYGPNSTSAAGIGVAGSVSVDRDFVVRSGQVSLSTLSTDSQATFSGSISGEGGVIVNSSNSWGLVRMTGINDYTGVTRVQNGTLEISDDRQLGAGGALVLASNQPTRGLQLAGDWTTSRTVNVLYESGFQTYGHDAVLNGSLTGSGELHKYGSGTLTINGSGSYDGKVYVVEGGLFINGATAANVFFDGELMGGSGRVSDLNFLGTFLVGAAPGAYGTFSAGSMTLLLGSQVAFDLGQDRIVIDTAFTKADQGFGSSVVFDFSTTAGLQSGQTYELVSFGGSNFEATDFTYTSANAGLQGQFVMQGGSLQFEVSAVPEPGAVWMLMAGLLGVGTIVRHRSAA
jgi:fibronectin-binding autotransporter adhesin